MWVTETFLTGDCFSGSYLLPWRENENQHHPGILKYTFIFPWGLDI